MAGAGLLTPPAVVLEAPWFDHFRDLRLLPLLALTRPRWQGCGQLRILRRGARFFVIRAAHRDRKFNLVICASWWLDAQVRHKASPFPHPSNFTCLLARDKPCLSTHHFLPLLHFSILHCWRQNAT